MKKKKCEREVHLKSEEGIFNSQVLGFMVHIKIAEKSFGFDGPFQKWSKNRKKGDILNINFSQQKGLLKIDKVHINIWLLIVTKECNCKFLKEKEKNKKLKQKKKYISVIKCKP